MTPAHAQDHITATKAGKYKIDASISIKNSSGAAHVISLEMYKNNGTTVFNNIHAGRTLGTGSDVGNLTTVIKEDGKFYSKEQIDINATITSLEKKIASFQAELDRLKELSK